MNNFESRVEAEQKVAEALFGVCSQIQDQWNEAILQHQAVWRISNSNMQVTLADGSQRDNLSLTQVTTLLDELRDAVATPEHGTWMSLILTVRPDGQFKFKYNYDEKPDWNIEPSNESYIEDLEHYPRPFAEIPDWHPAKALGSDAGK